MSFKNPSHSKILDLHLAPCKKKKEKRICQLIIQNWDHLSTCAFAFILKSQFILLFSTFLLLFIGNTVLFDTIHRSHCIISINFYLYLLYFQQKVFSFSKISRSQTDPKSNKNEIFFTSPTNFTIINMTSYR